MLPNYPVPYKDSKKFKTALSHHLRYFRFSHKTNIQAGDDLTAEKFFEPASEN
jgi:hypothetical protein